MRADFDAIIVGAGPAGSTAAIRLAQAGWSVALLERQSFPRRKVCGECIAATNLPLLHALGVGAEFDALAGPELRQAGLFAGDASLTAPLPAQAQPHAWGRALGREHLDTLLIDRACTAGATVLQPCTVRRIARDGDMHVCEAVDPDGDAIRLRAPVLIAAHGSWEPDPSLAEKRRPQRASDLFAFKANYNNARLVPGLLPVLAFPGGYGGIVLGDHGRTTLAFCVRRDALCKARLRFGSRKAAHAALAHVAANCRGVREALDGAALDDDWLTVGPIRPGIRAPYRGDGVFAIGNVAGEAHPILGEGISMAIQSAWLLSDRLIAQRDVCSDQDARDRAGRDYACAWRRSFTARIRLAAVFAHLAMRPDASIALLPLLRRWPGLITAGARAGGKVRRVVAFA
jgi:2-polyprenyl-6-methoxyphenol hydroxylase-like FAD-dependent oxidoreductase